MTASAWATPRRAAWIVWTHRSVFDMPLVVWMVIGTLAIGLWHGMSPSVLIPAFNQGFGRAIGEFALILLPSFTIAAVLSRGGVAAAGGGKLAALVSPAAGAGMICPDTAYAALSPIAAGRKLDVAFGAYAGFKLLFPAGPLIVAAGLGMDDPALLLVGLALTLPVWAAGVLWARLSASGGATVGYPDAAGAGPIPEGATPAWRLRSYRALLPFAVLALLLGAGAVLGSTGSVLLDFILQPKGALLAAAVVALARTAPGERRACLDGAVRRTGGLLLLIGAASAFGAVLTRVVSLDAMAPSGGGVGAILGLFALTVVFKLIQGSSMATFAAVAPVAAPMVLASGLAPWAAVYAICLGSFIAILPNDSFYWLVRRDAFDERAGEGRAMLVLAGGAVVQALVGLALLLAVTVIGDHP